MSESFLLVSIFFFFSSFWLNLLRLGLGQERIAEGAKEKGVKVKNEQYERILAGKVKFRFVPLLYLAQSFRKSLSRCKRGFAQKD